MATAPVDVFNIALSRCGVYNNAVADVNENTKQAGVCRVFYDRCRRYVLRDFPWRFAERIMPLSDLGNPPTNWSYKYPYPADCLMARHLVLPGVRRPRVDQLAPFQVMNDATNGSVLVTDLSPAELCYTTDVEDLNLWDEISVSALAYRLAGEIIMPLAMDPGLTKMMSSGYLAEVSRAAAAMLNEGSPDLEPESSFLTARGWDSHYPPDSPLYGSGVWR